MKTYKFHYDNNGMSYIDFETGFSFRQGPLKKSDSYVAPTIFDRPGLTYRSVLCFESMLIANGYHFGDDPEWSESGPELLDICITTVCHKGCKYCYQDAKSKGEHIDLDLYRSILKQTQKTVFQVALGGGEPTEHPELCEILRLSREDYNIVPNYTTNGDFLRADREYADKVLEATKKYCGAVAISAHGNKRDWEDKAIEFAEAGIKTNIHFIVSNKTIDEAIRILKENDLDDSLNAIVFLLYKPAGRASKNDILVNHDKAKELMDAVRATKLKVGFDACFAPILASKSNINTIQYDSCDGARFSAYVHVDGKMKACSFDDRDGFSLKDKSFREIWKNDFQKYRDEMLQCDCDCVHKSTCYGGCPVYKDIVLCNLECRK